MVRKIILRGVTEADLAMYLALDGSGMYYKYTELPLGYFIEKLPQARYLQITDKYVAIYHDTSYKISLVAQATWSTLRATEMIIMSSDGTDVPINLHEDLQKIFQEWYYNEYESPSAIIRRCLRNN
jgi:hypothetical protein